MAGLPRLPRTGVLHVLDPGAGSGVLSAAVVDRVRREAPDLEVALTAVEVDERLHGVLSRTLGDLEAAGARTRLVALATTASLSPKALRARLAS